VAAAVEDPERTTAREDGVEREGELHYAFESRCDTGIAE
jgi:hypothetical protein